MAHEPTIIVKWLDLDKNYLLWSFGERWTGQDYFHSLTQVLSSIDSTPDSIRLLIDLRESVVHPSNLTTLMRSAFRSDTCILEQVVVITPQKFWERVFTIVKKTDQAANTVPVAFVPTFEAATDYFEGLSTNP